MASESDLGVTILSSLMVVYPPGQGLTFDGLTKGAGAERHQGISLLGLAGRELDQYQRGCLFVMTCLLCARPRLGPMMEMKGEGLSPPLLLLPRREGEERAEGEKEMEK